MKTTAGRETPPWSMALGLLAACAVTLFGVARSMSTETILQRAVVAGFVIGIGIKINREIWQAARPKRR